VPDLADIPGVGELWSLTLGDPGVRIALIDGPIEREHPCLEGATIEIVDTGWTRGGAAHDMRVEHGTWVAGVLVGQHGGPAPGLAPGCTLLVVPGLRLDEDETDPINTARCIEAAVGAGADLIVLEQTLPSRSGDIDRLLKSVVRDTQASGVLLVVPAGNEETRYASFPQALPEPLVVGAHDDDGRMFDFSAHGFGYERHGIVAPGESINAPKPGGGLVRHKGTSCSTAIVGGIVGLLLSLQVRAGGARDPLAIRDVLLETAAPCTADDARGELSRCLAGKLDVAAATRRVLHGASPAPRPGGSHAIRSASARAAAPGVVPAESADKPAPQAPTGPLVYALGSLYYDLGSAARRDRFKQTMDATAVDGLSVPADPSDPRQVVDHLMRRPLDANGLIWTLNVELTPIYAIAPSGADAPAVYALLVALLAGELAGEGQLRDVGRVAVPGRLVGRTVELFSGQVVPVIELAHVRGIESWPMVALARAAELDQAAGPDGASQALGEFVTRAYYELRNLGLTGADRALNFAASAIVRAPAGLAELLAGGMALDELTVRRSERCRPRSDCWDVSLRFFHPENLRRERRVMRASVDVADELPVLLGAITTWSEPAPREAMFL
jgi:hypothetical protein